MTLHKEGTGLIVSIGLVLTALNGFIYLLSGGFSTAAYIILALSIIIYALVINFFRYEARFHPLAETSNAVVCPADGQVVVVEEVDEQEILGERCLQISVFMNVFNIHVNWIPSNGVVEHVSHSKGRFFAAHLPKASTDNERTAVIIRNEYGQKVLVRQIAGAVAQRIVTYPQVGDKAHINENLGFIKFGSRVDLYLPLGSVAKVKVGDKVQGNIDLMALLPEVTA